MHDRYDRVFRQQSNIGKWYNDGRKQLTMGAQKILWRNSGTHSRKVLRRLRTQRRDKLNDNCCMLKNNSLRSNKGVDSRRESWREPMRESKGDSRREST